MIFCVNDISEKIFQRRYSGIRCFGMQDPGIRFPGSMPPGFRYPQLEIAMISGGGAIVPRFSYYRTFRVGKNLSHAHLNRGKSITRAPTPSSVAEIGFSIKIIGSAPETFKDC